MLSKFHSRQVLVLTIAVFLLLVLGWSAGIVLADGQGGQWPLDPPPPTTGGGDGIQTLITFMTLAQLIL